MQITDFKDWLQVCSLIVAVICGLIGLFYLVRKENKIRTEELDKQFSGKWINEGAIDGPLETHYIELELSLKDREIIGVLSVNSPKYHTQLNCLSILGKRFRRRAKIDIISHQRGETQTIGEAILFLKKRIIVWKLLRGMNDYFPKRTKLWRNDNNTAA